MGPSRRSGHAVRGVFALILIAAISRPVTALASADELGFTVEVALSAKAAARLAALKEGITVAASFYGDPAPVYAKKADEMGQIDLGREEVTIPGREGGARITGRTVKRARIAWIKDRAALVNVNVYSARRSGPDNILDCDLYEGPAAVAARSPRTIRCKLIGEH